MDIIRPQITIRKTGFIRQLFGRHWIVYLQFGVEYINKYDVRTSMTCTRNKKTFKALKNALLHAEHIKTLVIGAEIIEHYNFGPQ